MREIKFRGKAFLTPVLNEEWTPTAYYEELDHIGIPHDKGWVYGSLIQEGNEYFIVGGVVECCEDYINHRWWVPVESDSVQQTTGVNDENGEEIWEGDEATRYDGEKFVTGKVVYREGAFWIDNGKDAVPLFDEITLSKTQSY